MKRLTFIFSVFILCFSFLGCETKTQLKPDVIKITLFKHLLKEPKPNEPGFVDEPLKEFNDRDSITKIMSAIRDNKPSAVSSNQMPQYELRIEYNGKFDSDGHTGRSLLLWLAPEGQSSEMEDEAYKGGDFYSLSPDATHILREIFR